MTVITTQFDKAASLKEIAELVEMCDQLQQQLEVIQQMLATAQAAHTEASKAAWLEQNSYRLRQSAADLTTRDVEQLCAALHRTLKPSH